MSASEVALTCHLVMPGGHPGDGFLGELCHDLDHWFGIGHTTVQTEMSPEGACALRPEHVVQAPMRVSKAARILGSR